MTHEEEVRKILLDLVKKDSNGMYGPSGEGKLFYSRLKTIDQALAALKSLEPKVEEIINIIYDNLDNKKLLKEHILNSQILDLGIQKLATAIVEYLKGKK